MFAGERDQDGVEVRGSQCTVGVPGLVDLRERRETRHLRHGVQDSHVQNQVQEKVPLLLPYSHRSLCAN